MGGAKRFMEQQQQEDQAAIDIAISAGALERCKLCDHTVYRGDVELEEVYRYANTQYTSGNYRNFSNRREMTDAIKRVVESPDHANDRCERCWEGMHGKD